MLSLAMNVPVSERLAMTGEITLTGKVLAVGGIREKVMAARQGNMKTVLLPAANKSDCEQLDDCVKNGMRGIFVKEYHEVSWLEEIIRIVNHDIYRCFKLHFLPSSWKVSSERRDMRKLQRFLLRQLRRKKNACRSSKSILGYLQGRIYLFGVLFIRLVALCGCCDSSYSNRFG